GVGIAPVFTQDESVRVGSLDGIAELMPDLMIGRITAIVATSVGILRRIESPPIDSIVAYPVLCHRAGRVVDHITYRRATAAVIEFWQAVNAEKCGVARGPFLERVILVIRA